MIKHHFDKSALFFETYSSLKREKESRHDISWHIDSWKLRHFTKSLFAKRAITTWICQDESVREVWQIRDARQIFFEWQICLCDSQDFAEASTGGRSKYWNTSNRGALNKIVYSWKIILDFYSLFISAAFVRAFFFECL